MDQKALLGEVVLPPGFPLPLDRPFTYRTALREAGLTSKDLQWLVDQGFLVRMLKGVYRANTLPDSVRVRCEALKLVIPTDAVIVDRHAGWLHGAEMVLAPNEHIDLAPIRAFLPAKRGRLRNTMTDGGERTFAAGDIMEIGGLRVTTPIRTAWDLGRNRWPERSLAAIDQMLRLGVFIKEELLAGLERFRGERWVTVLRAMAPLSDGRAESPPESVLRLRWIEVQLPTPTPQLEVWHGGDFLARLDLANEESHFGAEYDGVEWHDSPEQQAHDRRRRRLCEERADWLIQPFVKENVFGHSANAEQLLREGIAEARRRFGRRR